MARKTKSDNHISKEELCSAVHDALAERSGERLANPAALDEVLGHLMDEEGLVIVSQQQLNKLTRILRDNAKNGIPPMDKVLETVLKTGRKKNGTKTQRFGVNEVGDLIAEHAVDLQEEVDTHPMAQEPAVEEPAAEEPAVEEPAVEEPAAEEPAVEEPAVEEPAAEEPAAEEPAVEEPAAEEPAAEEPAVEEPAAEEPAAEEPAVEEPAAEEPAQETESPYIDGLDNIAAALAEATAKEYVELQRPQASQEVKDRLAGVIEAEIAKLADDYIKDLKADAGLEADVELAIRRDQIEKISAALAEEIKKNPKAKAGEEAQLEFQRTAQLDEIVAKAFEIKTPAVEEGKDATYNPLSEETIKTLKEKHDKAAKDAGISEEAVSTTRKNAQDVANNATKVGMSTGKKIGTGLLGVGVLLIAWNRLKAAFVGREATEQDVEEGKAEEVGERIRPSTIKVIGNVLLGVGLAVGAYSLGKDALSKDKQFGDTARDITKTVKGFWTKKRVDELNSAGPSQGNGIV